MQEAYQIVRNIFEQKETNSKNIVILFTDGTRNINIANLEKSL